MKHNPLSARIAHSPIALVVVVLALFVPACTTLPQLPAKPGQYQSNSSNSGNNPVVNINLASAGELEKLPGIGKGIAERIIAHRKRYGEFRRAEHVMMVRGISDRKFRAIRPMISVD